jgi:hypothetical protein
MKGLAMPLSADRRTAVAVTCCASDAHDSSLP